MDTIPDWFDKKLADKLVFPSDPVFKEYKLGGLVELKHVSFKQPELDVSIKNIDVKLFEKNTKYEKQKRDLETKISSSTNEKKTQKLQSKLNKLIKKKDTPTKSKKVNYADKIKQLTELITKTNDENILKEQQTKLKSFTTKYTKQQDRKDKITKSYSIRIPFNDDQHKIVQSWINECIEVYNACIDYYYSEDCDKTIITNYMKLKLIVFDIFFTQKNKNKTAPYDMLTGVVNEFCSNVKSCMTKLKEKTITHFELKKKNRAEFESILIPRKSITDNGIFSGFLGSIQNYANIYTTLINKIGSVECDSRLIYDSFTSFYYIKCPYYITPSECDWKRKEVVALDPGEKIFMSYYSLNGCGTIADNFRVKILHHEKNIRKYQRALANKKNKKKGKLKLPSRVKKKIKQEYRNIQNKVKELHNLTAYYLTNNYKNIIIPIFETQQMVSNGKKVTIYKKDEESKAEAKTREEIFDKKKEDIRNCTTKEELKVYKRTNRLNSRVKFVLNMMSHYKFRQHLAHKCVEKGCQLFVVTEEYTSQCCGVCGKCSKNYSSSRVKTCNHCKSKIDRDINGSRNILIKNWKSINN